MLHSLLRYAFLIVLLFVFTLLTTSAPLFAATPLQYYFTKNFTLRSRAGFIPIAPGVRLAHAEVSFHLGDGYASMAECTAAFDDYYARTPDVAYEFVSIMNQFRHMCRQGEVAGTWADMRYTGSDCEAVLEETCLTYR